MSFNYYADSVNGNDSNSGTTESSAFATLSALKTAALAFGNGVTLGLVAGSEWREQIDLSSINNISIGAAGDVENDGLPVIRGDDVLSGPWDNSTDRADANTNVHSRDITIAGGNDNWPNFWENDTRLVWVADVATCQSTAGSFTLSGGDGTGINAGTYTLYIHPTGSTDPDTDGNTYEGTLRTYGVFVGDNCTVKGIWGRRCAHNNGAFNGGLNSNYIALLGDGSLRHQALAKSGEMRYCLAWGEATDNRSGEIMLEFYVPNGTGLSGLWTECMAIHTDSIQVGFGGHTDGGGNNYETHSAIDCTCSLTGISIGDTVENGVINRPYIYNSMIETYAPTSTQITDPWCVIAGSGYGGASGSPCPVNGRTAAGSITINGLRFYGGASWNSGTFYILNFVSVAATVNIDRSVFVDTAETKNGRNIVGFSSSQECNANGLVFNNGAAGNTSRALFRSGTPTATYTGDDNVFWPDGANQCQVRVDGTTYATPAAYLTAVQPGSETNSVEANPSVTDPANGDFTLGGSGLPTSAGLKSHSVYKSYMTSIPANISAAETWVIDRFLSLEPESAAVKNVTRSVTSNVTRGAIR